MRQLQSSLRTYCQILTSFNMLQARPIQLAIRWACSLRVASMQSLVTVELPIISDHSMVTAAIKFDQVRRTETQSVARRCWRSFDIDAFKVDQMSSDFVVNPPDNCNEFSALYDRTFKSLLDKHAPLKPTIIHSRQSTPWTVGENSATGEDLPRNSYL